jgi:hypothetical protein
MFYDEEEGRNKRAVRISGTSLACFVWPVSAILIGWLWGKREV